MGNTFLTFLQEKGLYDVIEINESNYNELYDLLEGKEKLYTYCVKCKKTSVFQMKPCICTLYCDDGSTYQRELHEILRGAYKIEHMPTLHGGRSSDPWTWNPRIDKKHTRIIVLSFICTLDNNHYIDYIVQTDGNVFRKIGQFPTIADMEFPQLDQLSNVIDEQSRKELRRAIGLYAQGIGIGAYVYLRRVFERIVDEAQNLSISDNRFSEEDFSLKTVAEKIKMLKEYLPDMITRNAVVYGIVSKGIHEMSEEECISFFPVLKETIFIILRHWSEKKKEREAEIQLTKQISQIKTQLS